MTIIPFYTRPLGQTLHVYVGFKNSWVTQPEGNIFDAYIKMQHRTTTNKTTQGRTVP